jgi:hypothetical protein
VVTFLKAEVRKRFLGNDAGGVQRWQLGDIRRDPRIRAYVFGKHCASRRGRWFFRVCLE